MEGRDGATIPSNSTSVAYIRSGRYGRAIGEADDRNNYALFSTTHVASNSTNMRRMRVGKSGWDLTENAEKGTGHALRWHDSLSSTSISLYKERVLL